MNLFFPLQGHNKPSIPKVRGGDAGTYFAEASPNRSDAARL